MTRKRGHSTISWATLYFSSWWDLQSYGIKIEDEMVIDRHTGPRTELETRSQTCQKFLTKPPPSFPICSRFRKLEKKPLPRKRSLF